MCQELCQVPFRGIAVEPRVEALHSLVQLGTIWHDSCALLYTARAGWGSCSGGQPGVVVTDVCGGGRKWPNEDDCSARHSAGLIAI